jgi:penicillin-binding protein 1C
MMEFILPLPTLKMTQTPVGKKIISAAANYMITDILSRVNRPDFPLNWQATEHMPKIAWKTGTSYGRRDAWSIGCNKNYTIGVWVGIFPVLGLLISAVQM